MYTSLVFILLLWAIQNKTKVGQMQSTICDRTTLRIEAMALAH
jgi:hypothetical protein